MRKTKEEVAVKKLDLENMNCSLDEIIREAQTMRSLNHPNLLPLYASFVHEQNLWMVMPYVHGGSVLNIMRYKYPDGLEEPAIATVMKEVLKALQYLHHNGIIHRDIKAGNVLLDDDGHVLLADFGVAATLERGGSWGNRIEPRNTFVGTPCWMAPEVMQQDQGYDSRADIWSFGITLLELAHGHAPFAKLPPMKVLLMTLQNPPPTLEQANSKRHFSKAMRDIVAKCLVKDPRLRPSASQLLEHKFFKTAHDAHYLQQHVLKGLPPVPLRVEEMRRIHAKNGDGPMAAQEREILASQQEYRRGVSSWNFDVEALKAAAAAGQQEYLPSINEGLEHCLSMESLNHRKSDASASAEAYAADLNSLGEISSPPSTVQQGSVPTGTTPGKMGPVRAGIKEQGRFKIYEGGDEPPFFSPENGTGVALMEEAVRAGSRSTTPGPAGMSAMDESIDIGEAAERAKVKGRFRYVEEDGTDGKPRVPKSGAPAVAVAGGTGADGRQGGAVGPTADKASAAVLLAPLKELLESATLQHEILREMVAAVKDVEKGKMGPLTAFLQQRQQLRPSSGKPIERWQAEVAELKEENARLRERLKMYEGNDVPSGATSMTVSRRQTSAEDGV